MGQGAKMEIIIREFEPKDIQAMCEIWNTVVDEANAFPQNNKLDVMSGTKFFGEQTFTGVAEDIDKHEILAMYILHPNNVGRCSHICNASYAVKKEVRGTGIGRKVVEHSLAKGKERGFHIMQFNAVTASNTAAHAVYEKLGFTPLGIIPEGFLRPDGSYDDIRLYFKKL